METQHQHSQNHEQVDKLILENIELKKNLEREQLLHKMLYKEWKELNEQVLAKENEVQGNDQKKLFYKYAFYVLVISIIPAYYFLNRGKGIEKLSPSVSSVSKPNIPIKDSTPINNAVATTNKNPTNDQNTVQQPPAKSPVIVQPAPEPPAKPPVVQQPSVQQQAPVQQPVVKSQEKIKIQGDTNARKVVTITKPVVENPLTDSTRDLIYWQGWNAYYDRSRNPFKKSSERYKAWIEGWNDGKNDARKLLAKDSLLK